MQVSPTSCHYIQFQRKFAAIIHNAENGVRKKNSGKNYGIQAFRKNNLEFRKNMEHKL
jgi:hypothetical protein